MRYEIGTRSFVEFEPGQVTAGDLVVFVLMSDGRQVEVYRVEVRDDAETEGRYLANTFLQIVVAEGP
jgi:hypothetical protein